MPIKEFGSKSYDVDDEGYLVDFEKWDENFAIYSAKNDRLELTETHWEIINFLRVFFEKYRFSLMIKMLVKEIKKEFGPEKVNTGYLYELFSQGPAKQSARYAGLPKPT